LQQTQVATVVDYYQRFLLRFPNVSSLAEAEEQEVLSYWAGLGYYRRARQLHSAAQQIVTQHAGRFPQTLQAVQSLPGIGRYTAGAICSFAFHTRAPILEANTVRLFSRLIGLCEDPKLAISQAALWDFAEKILPTAGPRIAQMNQATMELGSLVCTPRAPGCTVCPLTEHCVAHQQGQQAAIPLRSERTPFTALTHVLVVATRGKKVLLRLNPAGGWWAGLWDFPRVDVTETAADGFFSSKSADPPSQDKQLACVDRAVRERFQLACQTIDYLKTIKHGVTRYRIEVHCFRGSLPRTVKLADDQTWQWIELESAHQLPLTSTAEKLRRWLLTL